METIYTPDDLTFNAETHRYRLKGKSIPSHSAIMQYEGKPQVSSWQRSRLDKLVYDIIEKHGTLNPSDFSVYANGLAEQLKQEDERHLDIGKCVHKAAEYIMKGLPIQIETDHGEEVKRGISAFREMVAKHNLKPLHLEKPLCSFKYMYGVTPDFIGYYEGYLSIIEYKTSSGFFVGHNMQAAAQNQAAIEFLGIKPERHFIFRFDKGTGLPYEQEVYNIEEAFRKFLAVKEIYDYAKAFDKAKRKAKKASGDNKETF